MKQLGSKKTIVILIAVAAAVCLAGAALAIGLTGASGDTAVGSNASSIKSSTPSRSQSSAVSSIKDKFSSSASNVFSSAMSSMFSSDKLSSAISSATSSKPVSSATSSKPVSSATSSTIKPYDPIEDGLVLTWSDDFDGTALDTTKWDLCPEWERGDIGARWDGDMVELDGKGNLVLKVGIENGQIVSGGVRTLANRWYRVLFSQTKGYFEIRAKLQSVPGFWSAFWLLSQSQSKVGNGAKDGVEIDVFESFNYTEGQINHALHWDGYGDDHKGTGKEITNRSLYDGNFHTFGMLWADDGYYFYVDGKMTYKLTGSSSKYPGCCEVPCYLKITTEVGSWAGSINKKQLPTDGLVVDYVKVYQFQ